jgi:hypothetical protein
VYDPSVVGVPLRTPVDESVMPGGSVPDCFDHVAVVGELCGGFVLVTDCTVSCFEYVCPSVPPGTVWS